MQRAVFVDPVGLRKSLSIDRDIASDAIFPTAVPFIVVHIRYRWTFSGGRTVLQSRHFMSFDCNIVFILHAPYGEMVYVTEGWSYRPSAIRGIEIERWVSAEIDSGRSRQDRDDRPPRNFVLPVLWPSIVETTLADAQMENSTRSEPSSWNGKSRERKKQVAYATKCESQ